MLDQWKREWKAFEESPPGERFERRYRARKKGGKAWVRVASVIVGLALIVGGAILLVIPGPGLLVIAFGGGLVAQEFHWMAVALDWLELRLRELFRWGLRVWKGASALGRAAIVLAGAVLAAGAGYVAYLLLFKK